MASEFTGQNCGIYPRVSSKKQSEKDKTSLKDQATACRDYARGQGMTVIEECVKPEAYTSTKTQRPALDRLIAEMKARRVPNLIIDRVDRMTRAGILAAAEFLSMFTRASITLHIVSMGDEEDGALVVRTDKDVKAFVDAAYDAQQDNKKRVRIIKRAKRTRARDGIYLRGNRAPYGYRYDPVQSSTENDEFGNPKVIDKRLEPDTRLFSDRGFVTLFAPNPYEARLKMIRLYAEGMSCQDIADKLNEEGVPSGEQLHHRSTVAKWWGRTVGYLVIDNSLNDGVLTNFRHSYQEAKPDDRHPEGWVQVRAAPESARITVTPAHGGPAPLMDASLAARYAQRRAARRVAPPPHVDDLPLGPALLAGGGLVFCAGCGKPLAYSTKIRRTTKRYRYYYCRHHLQMPSECSGLSFPVAYLDMAVWNAFLVSLFELGKGKDNDNFLDKLAKQQAALDYSGTPVETLEDLRAARDKFQKQVNLLARDLTLLLEESVTGRAAIRAEMDKLEPAIREADRKIAAMEQQVNRIVERRQLLNDYLHQWHLYSGYVLRLDPTQPRDIPLMAAVMRLVGARVTVSKDTNGEPDIAIDLTLTPAAAGPWFSAEEMRAGTAGKATIDTMSPEEREREGERRWAWPDDPTPDTRTPEEIERDFRARLHYPGGEPVYPELAAALDDPADDVVNSSIAPATDAPVAPHRPLPTNGSSL